MGSELRCPGTPWSASQQRSATAAHHFHFPFSLFHFPLAGAVFARHFRMETPPTAAAFLPDKLSLSSLRKASATCRGCDLWKNATQTVFGEGLKRAKLIMIGEQPGNEEDLEGLPFVGPAGRELDRGLEEAGIVREDVFVTNVVKHFKWEPRGKRRIHKKPNAVEIQACLPWLEAEIAVVRPEVLLCLGATASKAMFGSSFRVTVDRGTLINHPLVPRAGATIHPSAILRAPDDQARRREREAFVDDLRTVRQWLDAG